MGTYCFYFTTSNNAAGCKINWAAMNKETLKGFWRLAYAHDKDLPNLEEVAKLLDESKLIGYMDETTIAAFVEFNANLVPYGFQPRIYFTYEGDDHVYCLEFIPGSNGLNILEFETKDITKEPLRKAYLSR